MSARCLAPWKLETAINEFSTIKQIVNSPTHAHLTFIHASPLAAAVRLSCTHPPKFRCRVGVGVGGAQIAACCGSGRGGLSARTRKKQPR